MAVEVARVLFSNDWHRGQSTVFFSGKYWIIDGTEALGLLLRFRKDGAMTQEIIDTTSGKIPMRTHWIPRMVAVGLQYEDLQDLLQSIDSWDVWCREWSAKGAMHESWEKKHFRKAA